MQELVSMAERFASWRRRYPEDGDGMALAQSRARELEARVCHVAGVAPEAIARLSWADDALADAAGAGERS
jgi:hypothetical protein